MSQQQTFAQWMKRVDSAIGAQCGLSSDDLSDVCYRDWYDSDVTPREAARMALEENGFDADEEEE